MRTFFAKFVTFGIVVTVSVIYLPALEQISNQYGALYMAPIWLTALVGMIVGVIWLESAVVPKKRAPRELHNTQFPVPVVRAFDWTDDLLASEEVVDEAFISGRTGQSKGFLVVAKDSSELVGRWRKRGWEIEISPFGEPVKQIAVNQDSEWAGKEVLHKGLQSLFAKRPQDRLDEGQAKALVRHFLGWADQPEGIDWAAIRFTG